MYGYRWGPLSSLETEVGSMFGQAAKVNNLDRQPVFVRTQVQPTHTVPASQFNNVVILAEPDTAYRLLPPVILAEKVVGYGRVEAHLELLRRYA
jgi:hypothetical protein